MATKKTNDTFRTNAMTAVRALFEQQDNEVLVIGSNKFAIPYLDDERNEKWLTITFTVPKGSRDGDEFDGYGLRDEYDMKQQEKAEKAKAAAEKKAAKIAKDKAAREEKARLKAEQANVNA